MHTLDIVHAGHAIRNNATTNLKYVLANIRETEVKQVEPKVEIVMRSVRSNN